MPSQEFERFQNQHTDDEWEDVDLETAFEAGRRAEKERILGILVEGTGKPLRFCPVELVDAIRSTAQLDKGQG